jgi:hypothetical protein
LGVTGFCRIWIHRYAALARSLYQFLKDAQWGSQSLLEWDPENTKAFQVLKLSLQTAPALSLPTKNHFQLYAYAKGGITLGVLTQLRGPTPQPVGYLNKEQDNLSKGGQGA